LTKFLYQNTSHSGILFTIVEEPEPHKNCAGLYAGFWQDSSARIQDIQVFFYHCGGAGTALKLCGSGYQTFTRFLCPSTNHSVLRSRNRKEKWCGYVCPDFEKNPQLYNHASAFKKKFALFKRTNTTYPYTGECRTHWGNLLIFLSKVIEVYANTLKLSWNVQNKINQGFIIFVKCPEKQVCEI
jgi:hypothetical protein